MSGKTEAVMAEIRRIMDGAKRPIGILIARPTGSIQFVHDPEKDRNDQGEGELPPPPR